MLKKFTGSFLLALQNIRSHFFHTLLSILGIVIGVAALVIILSLIDGMEVLARKQLSAKTSVKAVSIRTEPTKSVNQVRIRKDTFALLTPRVFKNLDSLTRHQGKLYFYTVFSREVRMKGSDSLRGANIFAISASSQEKLTVKAGGFLQPSAFEHGQADALINHHLALSLQPDSLKWSQLLGDTLTFAQHHVRVIGVVDSKATAPEVFVSITFLTEKELQMYPPQAVIEAHEVEYVASLKENVVRMLAIYAIDPTDFVVETNEFWVDEVTKGFLLFRIIMGLIVGVSVLVGGIGVMNVLLISVTERTVEIGVRKAVGANRRDIVMQFLAESITVSIFGSGLGLLLGFVVTVALVPIVKILVNVPFEAAYTWNTFVVVSVIAVLIGVMFGTYPALRASRLDPVEAIRRE